MWHGNPISRKRWVLIISGILVLLLLSAAGFLYSRARHSEELIRSTIVLVLSKQFKSDAELRAVQIKIFPRIVVMGAGLSLHYHGRLDSPPLVRIEHFTFAIGVFGLLRPAKHIPLVQIDQMTITIPPREPKKAPTAVPSSSQAKEAALAVVVDQVICKATNIVILPKKSGNEPLDWDIHELFLDSVSMDKPFAFHGHLTNGKPVGEIETHGKVGPWDMDDPGGSPVSGEYKFSGADLDPFRGIAGTLSSTGKYSGVLSELQVQGQTDTPNFSLDKVGRPVPLYTDYSATVDGTNGDTYLHPVNGTLIRSLIVAEGSIVKVPERKGHLITLDASVPNGRIQDILSLAINSGRPLMTGPVKIKARLILPPGKEKVLDKIVIDGNFGVDDAKWSSPAIREQLESLSRHGEGKPADTEAGSSVSDLKGSFHLERGVIQFNSLTFSVPGAAIDLTGTYALSSGNLDFNGHLRLQAKLSQTTTGAKSFLLKAFDPFFKKDYAGTVLPITITGTRDKPTFGVSVLHKTIKKQVDIDKSKLTSNSAPR
jgi:hypothetical protein